MARKYYPMFVSLTGRTCLVIGGGSVGERKIRKLIEHDAKIHLVARSLTPWLEECCQQRKVMYLGTEYKKVFIRQADLVFAATDDPELNRQIATDANQAGAWCNMASDPEAGSFIVAAVHEQGPLSIAVATSGVSPAAAARIRDQLAQQFGDQWARYLELLGRLRRAIQERTDDPGSHQDLFRRLADLPLLQWAEKDDSEKALDALGKLCMPPLTDEELATLWDETWVSSS